MRAQTFHSLGQERMDYLEGMMGDSADLHNKVAGFMVYSLAFCLAKRYLIHLDSMRSCVQKHTPEIRSQGTVSTDLRNFPVCLSVFFCRSFSSTQSCQMRCVPTGCIDGLKVCSCLETSISFAPIALVKHGIE